MEYNRRRHSVYLLTYHIVFVTKYRRPCISDELGDFLKDLCQSLVEIRGGELLSAETDRDHVHLLVSLPPAEAPAAVVRIIKARTSRVVHEDPKWDAQVQPYLRGNGPLWAPSYFIATTGTSVLEKIKAYIDSQRTEEHQQKYAGRKSQPKPSDCAPCAQKE